MCSGYYDYDEGYLPDFAGMEPSPGPSCTRSTGLRTSTTPAKRVVVIGSGATAITLVPAMAKTAAHVTMLQRSPTYVVSLPESPAWRAAQGVAGGCWPGRPLISTASYQGSSS